MLPVLMGALAPSQEGSQSGSLFNATGPTDSLKLLDFSKDGNSITNNYFMGVGDKGNPSSGQLTDMSSDQHALTSQSGCCHGKDKGMDGSSSDFTSPSPFGSADLQMEDFDGEQKLVNHDGESYVEFYDEEGDHIDTMSMDDFEQLQQKATEGGEGAEEAIEKLEELGASDELIGELQGEEGACGCDKSEGQHDGPSSTADDTGLEDFSLDYNEETGEVELNSVQSFDSMDDAKAAYEDAEGDAGLRFNDETGKWELQNVESFDDMGDALDALKALPDPVQRADDSATHTVADSKSDLSWLQNSGSSSTMVA